MNTPHAPCGALLEDDPELLHRFRRGCSDALTQVYVQYRPPLRYFLQRHVTHGVLAARARWFDFDDVIQEAFIRALSDKARAAYDGSRPFTAYLNTIARNLVRDYLRRPEDKARSCVAVARTADQAVPEPAFDENTRHRTMNRIEAAVFHLPDELYAVYHQRFVLGRSQARTGAILGITRQVLRTRERRLCERLRALCDEELPSESACGRASMPATARSRLAPT